MKKYAIVTGGTGFVGKNLIHKLILEGWSVKALFRKSSNLKKLLYDDLNYVDIYIVDDNNTVLGVLKDIARRVDVKRTVVFHIAALVQGGECKDEDIEELISSNVTYGTKIASAAIKVGIKNLITTGTAWQHYHDDTYNPVNLYAASKEALDVILKFYEEVYELKKITLQLFDTYGENDSRKKIIDLIIDNSRNGQILDMSPGEQYIDLVYIDDVINAYIIAADYLIKQDYRKCGIYGISSEEPIKLKELVKLIEQLTGNKTKINFGGREYRQREVMMPWKNHPILPGWNRQISIKEGLLRILNKS